MGFPILGDKYSKKQIKTDKFNQKTQLWKKKTINFHLVHEQYQRKAI